MASTAAYNDKSAPVYSPTSAQQAIPYAIQVDAQPHNAQQQYAAPAAFSVVHTHLPPPQQQQLPAVNVLPASPARSSGRWNSPLFNCFAAPGHCLMAFIFPCVNGAYAAHGINKSAALVGVLLFLAYTATLVFAALSEDADGTWRFFHFSRYDDDGYYYHDYEYTKWDSIETVASMVFVATVVWLRRAAREFYRIPGSTINDCCASFWCSCCVLMQLSAHTAHAKAAQRASAATLPAYQAA